MRRTLPALLLLVLWSAALVFAAMFVQRQLRIGADLRLFLPSPTTAEQRLVLEGMGEGPAARMLVIALAGATPERLADVSRTLVEALRENPLFRLIANGEIEVDAFPEDLLPYRFLLSPTLDTHRLDREYLHAQLEARARDLASPAGLLLEPLLPRDPTLELLTLLQRWQPGQEPRREFDVWFDAAGQRALLVAETRAPAFDPDGQRAALAALDDALATAGGNDIAMTVSGAGSFSVMMETRTREETQDLGRAATIGMILLLLVAYRSIGSVVLSALPLASAALAGLTAVSAVFETVHGITLAFGFTLIGVAQDYPIHLLSHRQAHLDPRQTARGLWPTLATGIASTCIAYATFFFVGVAGLAQLACFTVVGVAVAGGTTRFVLPFLVAPNTRDYGDSRLLGRLSAAITSVPRPAWAGVTVVALCGVVIALAPQPFWQNDLAELTPVPADLLTRDQELRAQLGTADLRYVLVVNGKDTQAALQRLEALEPALQQLVDRGAITGYDHAARYVPAAVTQEARRARLPDTATLQAELSAAVATTPFRPGAFAPFVADVATARMLEPFTPDQARSLALGSRLELLLRDATTGATALVTFAGVKDAATLRELATGAGDVTLLDIRQASEELVAQQRTRILFALAGASLLLIAVVWLALRRASRVLRVLAPMAITTLVVIAALQAAGVSLNLFHLISLILTAGLGLDYALFFEHAANDPAEQRRTLHAVLVCALSTLLVFSLLAASTLPVLRAIGAPVAIGVVANFLLSLLLTRAGSRS